MALSATREGRSTLQKDDKGAWVRFGRWQRKEASIDPFALVADLVVDGIELHVAVVVVIVVGLLLFFAWSWCDDLLLTLALRVSLGSDDGLLCCLGRRLRTGRTLDLGRGTLGRRRHSVLGLGRRDSSLPCDWLGWSFDDLLRPLGLKLLGGWWRSLLDYDWLARLFDESWCR